MAPKIVLIIKLISLLLFFVQLNINKGFHGICESQNNDWDCKNQSINLLHLVINLFYMHWFFKYITYLNGFRNLA